MFFHLIFYIFSKIVISWKKFLKNSRNYPWKPQKFQKTEFREKWKCWATNLSSLNGIDEYIPGRPTKNNHMHQRHYRLHLICRGLKGTGYESWTVECKSAKLWGEMVKELSDGVIELWQHYSNALTPLS